MTAELAQSLLEASQDARSVEALKPEESAQALTLMAEGLSLTATQKKTGIDRKTLGKMRSRHAEFLVVGRAEKMREASRLATKLCSLAMQRAVLLDPQEAESDEDRQQRIEALKKTNLRELMISFGVGTDKALVLAGVVPPVQAVDYKPGIETVRAAMKEARQKVAKTAAADKAELDAKVAGMVQRQLAEMEGAAEKVVELVPGTRSKAGS